MIDNQIEFLKLYFEGLKNTISEAKKKGLDTRMADLWIMNVPQKIRYLEISKNKEDIQRLKVILAQAEKEIPKLE